MRNTEKISGKFVNLRPIVKSDAALTLSWRQAKNAQFLNTGSSNITEQELWITNRPTNEYNYIIELKNEHPIGMLSLTAINLINRHGEPGRFLIGDKIAAQGIPAAVESMKLLYDLAFGQLGLTRVFGIIPANNISMIKWQKYFGMQEEGRLRNHLFQNGKFVDAIYFGMLVEEYIKTTAPRMNTLINIAQKSPSKNP